MYDDKLSNVRDVATQFNYEADYEDTAATIQREKDEKKTAAKKTSSAPVPVPTPRLALEAPRQERQLAISLPGHVSTVPATSPPPKQPPQPFEVSYLYLSPE